MNHPQVEGTVKGNSVIFSTTSLIPGIFEPGLKVQLSHLGDSILEWNGLKESIIDSVPSGKVLDENRIQ